MSVIMLYQQTDVRKYFQLLIEHGKFDLLNKLRNINIWHILHRAWQPSLEDKHKKSLSNLLLSLLSRQDKEQKFVLGVVSAIGKEAPRELQLGLLSLLSNADRYIQR